MKQYVIDQLRPADYWQLVDYLNANAASSALEGIYRVDLPEDLCTVMQREHTACGPHYFAVNLDVNQVAFELLIRSSQVLRCQCIAYATREQRDFIIGFADRMLEDLKIKI